MNFSSLLGERLKAERARIGLNQAEIAEKVGVSREMWGKYERGLAIPGGEVLFSFSGVGADAHYLMTGGRMGESLSDLSAEEIELLNNYKKMNTEDRAAILHLSGAVLKK